MDKNYNIIVFGKANASGIKAALRQAKTRPMHKELCAPVERKIPETIDAPATSSAWFGLDGDTLELGSTGFYIKITTNIRFLGCSYAGFSPEHKLLLGGDSLTSVKLTIERLAQERDEFAPRKIDIPRFD